MKKLVFFFLFSPIFFYLPAQDISISFQPKVGGTLIDSIWVTNQRTNQKVKLLRNESVILTKSTGVGIQFAFSESGYLYPNPCIGGATLNCSVTFPQKVEIRVFNITGQILTLSEKELTAGLHSFQIHFPVPGLYTVSVLKTNGSWSQKVINAGTKRQEFSIEYSGSKSLNQLKSVTTDKTLIYVLGDFIYCTVYAGNTNTIIIDSPVATQIYSVEFEGVDLDANSYKVVKISSQVWMAENLKVTKYRDGTAIPNVTDHTAWVGLSTGAYCWYNNNSIYQNLYGKLYNWYAVGTGKLCPAGWHIPSDAEWAVLENYLIANRFNYDGTTTGNKIAKALAANTNWAASTNIGAVGNSLAANNKSGFSGLPGGSRDVNVSFYRLGNEVGWWSSTELSSDNNYAWCRSLYLNNTTLSRPGYDKKTGISVRCVRD